MRATIEVEWTGEANVADFLEAVCDMVMTALLNFDGVEDPSVTRTLKGCALFHDPSPARNCGHGRPSPGMCPWCLGLNGEVGIPGLSSNDIRGLDDDEHA